jgi:hypothetical protein
MELWSQGLGVDYHRVFALCVEDADLEQRSVSGWAYEHREIVIQKYPSHRCARHAICLGR